MKNKICAMLTLAYLSFSSTGVSGQALETYMKNMNSLVPVSPETNQMMKHVDWPVNLFTGTANITLPLYTVKGKGIEVPISLSYHAGGGIKVDELAGECGLGWSLFTGGEISREVRGAPDEGGGSGMAAGLFNNPHPISFYYSQMLSSSPDHLVLQEAARSQRDLEPDIYYFRFGTKSGKFIYNEATDQFECIVQQPIKIIRHPAGTFSIIDENGISYRFGATVKTSTRSECVGNGYGQMSNFMTTSWKINRIVNADHTDSIEFGYSSEEYGYYSPGTSTMYQLYQGPGIMSRPSTNCYNKTVIQDKRLNLIISGTDSVSFERNMGRNDLPTTGALTDIVFADRSGTVKHIFKMAYDYYPRPVFVGGFTPEEPYNDESLRLLSLTDYGNAVTNTNPLKWTFGYNPMQLPGRLSYAQDFWGYANSNTYHSLVPKQWMAYNNNQALFLDGANRYVDTTKMKAGILETITNPTGGQTTFEYEPNTTSLPTPYSLSNTITMQHLIVAWRGANQNFSSSVDSYKLSFIVDNIGAHPEINGNRIDGGAIANIEAYSSAQLTPPNPAHPADYDPDKINFWLNGPSPSGHVFTANKNNHYLTPGSYEMEVRRATYLNQNEFREDIRNLVFSVTYKMKDTAGGPPIYYSGGLRIKSITATDQYAGMPTIKEYIYADPVTDSSYGFFIGHGQNTYLDMVHDEVSPLPASYTNDQYSTYLVRIGNCIMPGGNAHGANVIYPKVMEQTRNGNKVNRTEYLYRAVAPMYSGSYPFMPPFDNESARGNILSSLDLRDDGGSVFTPIRKKSYVYEETPYSNVGNNSFINGIFGIRAVAGGYSVDASPLAEFKIPVLANHYVVFTRRAYMTSDTITEYLGNGTPNKRWNSYLYGDYNQLPVEIKSGNSDGSISTQKNWFAVDGPDASLSIPVPLEEGMVESNRVGIPLASKSYKDNQLMTQEYTYARIVDRRFLVDSMRRALLNADLETEIKVTAYNEYANPLKIELKGGRYRKYLWEKKMGLPLATCSMSSDDGFYFTSFEHLSEVGWNDNARISNVSFSGQYAYNLSGQTMSIAGFNGSRNVEVYAWKTGGNFSANGEAAISTGRSNGQWSLFKVVLPIGTTYVNITGSATIDHLAIVPSGSSYEANVYDASGRVSAKTDDNMRTSFFEYDNFGRLSIVRDEQSNILKKNVYQYQGPQ